MNILVIMNATAGRVQSQTESERQRIEKLFRTANVPVVLESVLGSQLTEHARIAATSNFDTIVAAGGDGTVSSIASLIARTDKVLGILPMGTLNHFARDLKIPFKLEDAVRVILKGIVEQIDVGFVNGRIFLNNCSIGVYPKIIGTRNEFMRRLRTNRWMAMAYGAIRVFKRYPMMTLDIIADEREIIRTTPFLFVGNNKYEIHFLTPGVRNSLQGGKLSVYLPKKPGRFSLMALFFRAIFGLISQEKDFDLFLLPEVHVRAKYPTIHLAMDGELALVDLPLHFRILNKVLRVCVPAKTTA